jgi:phosphatidylcholine synthase
MVVGDMSTPTSPFRHNSTEFTPAEWGRAWLVHLFTALGIVASMLALRDVLIGDVGHAKRAIIWLLLTLVIDGVDGPIARALEVERRVPLIDGFLLDLIIDYVACVIVPVCFMYEFNVVPNNNFGVFVLCVVVFTSAIWFARKDMMTEDNWFRGFPAAWNMVGPLLYLMEAREGVGAAITLVLSVLSLTSMPFPHIARARFMRYWTWAATVCWLGGMAIGALTLPHHYEFVRVLLYLGAGYFLLLAAIRAVHERRLRRLSAPAAAPASTAEAR